jgi:putative transposase
VAVVCRVLGAPRSTIYVRRRPTVPAHAGPATSSSNPDLLGLIRQVLVASPFAGEGDRKVRARQRREHGIRVGGNRVLRLLRREGRLAPQRVRGRRKPRPHDGTIIPTGPNQRWGTDATMAWTRADGWVGVLACIDRDTAEVWAHPAKVGDRFAALQPVSDAVIDRFGGLGPDLARGLSLLHHWGPQYRSAHFLVSIGWLGIADDAAWLPDRVAIHQEQLARPEVLWVAYAKGNRTDLNRDSLWPILGEHGLRPVTQVSIDQMWSSLASVRSRRARPNSPGGRS